MKAFASEGKNVNNDSPIDRLLNNWDLALVVQKMERAIHLTSIRETNCVIHWIEIYPVDSAIYLLNNWGLYFTL